MILTKCVFVAFLPFQINSNYIFQVIVTLYFFKNQTKYGMCVLLVLHKHSGHLIITGGGDNYPFSYWVTVLLF